MHQSGYEGMDNDLNEKLHCSNVGLEEQLHTGGNCVSARHSGTMQEATASALSPSYRPVEQINNKCPMGVNVVQVS